MESCLIGVKWNLTMISYGYQESLCTIHLVASDNFCCMSAVCTHSNIAGRYEIFMRVTCYMSGYITRRQGLHIWKSVTYLSMLVADEDNVNSSSPGQHGRHFADDIFKCVFVNENIWISKRISLKFVLKGPIDNNTALVEITAWRRPSDKSLSEPILTQFTHIYMRH